MLPSLDASDVATIVQLLEVTASRGAYELDHYALVKQTFDHYSAVIKKEASLNPMFLKHAADLIVLASTKHCFVIQEFGTMHDLHGKLVTTFQRFMEQPLTSNVSAADTPPTPLALPPSGLL
jgi:hypothetical protein